jgi:hypothetical protein
MTKLLYAALLALGCGAAPSTWAATLEGTLVQGGGTDDLFITVHPAKGAEVVAYCLDRCGDWFDAGEAETQHLKPALVGRAVRLSYAVESNKGRIVGPETDEPLAFLKVLQFLPPAPALRPVACSQEKGARAAAALVDQCLRVSPATHPPCNASNACGLIQDEIDRGCGLLKNDPGRPAFCRRASAQ